MPATGIGTLNGIKNGARIKPGAMVRLTLGTLPLTMRRQLAVARKYRRSLEQMTMQAKGSVDIVDAHHIDTASSAQVHCSIMQWLLRERLDKMATSDIARCSEQIVKAKAIRDKSVMQLGLDREEALDVIDALYTAKAERSIEPQPESDR